MLQHADNPVHWYAWGDDAFEAAREQDKPIFLSIGYATCHWCHVMAHESFEDEGVAELMNDTFINIKVDREERPDIDKTYMQVCQLLTGRGGWPLTILMTPDKKPFFAATYIPKTRRGGQTGLTELIPQIKQFWETDRNNLEGSAREITQAFQESIELNDPEKLPSNILDIARKQLGQQFDDEYGGFSEKPKFPTPQLLTFLLRYANEFNDNEADAMVEKTLLQMAQGGIYDHIGGGFHRYSTDRQWLVPHFEKMLHDQAMLLMAYSEAWKSIGNPLFKQTAKEIVSYLMRDMQGEGGAFYSAEDADSEDREGAFYVWTQDEIEDALSPDDAELAVDIFNTQPDGNYVDETTGGKTGKNILHQTKPHEKLAEEHDLDLDPFRRRLGKIKCQLFGRRSKRERPFLDDKILTDWNGLTVAAFAKAGRLLDKPKYIDQAKQTTAFILENLATDKGELLHRYRSGEAAVSGTADDYAFVIWGLLELYESAFDSSYLKKAISLQDIFLKTHWDNANGGFFFTSETSEALLGRKKEYFDSALPSGNSVAMMNLLRLGRISANTEWEEKADAVAQSNAENLSKIPGSFTQLLQGHLWAVKPTYEIVVAGEKSDPKTQAFLKEINNHFLPQSVVILNDPNDENIRDIASYLEHQPMIDGKPTVYICRNYACKEPLHDVDQIGKKLDIQ